MSSVYTFKRMPVAPDGSEKETGIEYCSKSGSETVDGVIQFRRMPTGMGECVIFKRFPFPVAAFAADPVSGDMPLTVTFTDTSVYAESWAWDFGDGGTSTDQNPAHEYTAAGDYTATLTVTNPAGTDTATTAISVTASAPVWLDRTAEEYWTSTNIFWDDVDGWSSYSHLYPKQLDVAGDWAAGMRPQTVRITYYFGFESVRIYDTNGALVAELEASNPWDSDRDTTDEWDVDWTGFADMAYLDILDSYLEVRKIEFYI